MKTKILLAVSAMALGVAAVVVGAAGQDQKGTAPSPNDQKAMMDAMTKYATPGQPHKQLAAMSGVWTARVKDLSAPGTPQESDGTATFSMVLGGRYQELKYTGMMMGQRFSGLGYTAYDNAAKKYINVWMDSGGTGMSRLEGEADASGKVIKMSGNMVDPISGKTIPIRTVLTIQNNDHMLYEMMASGPGGHEATIVEIAYTRKTSPPRD